MTGSPSRTFVTCGLGTEGERTYDSKRSGRPSTAAEWNEYTLGIVVRALSGYHLFLLESSQGCQIRVVAKNGIECSRVLSGVIAWHGHEGGGITVRDWR